MAYAPVKLFATPMEDYAAYWVKFYEQGTVTPLSMATDAGAGTLLAKAEVSSGGTVPIGFIKTAGDALFIPFMNADYDSWLFPTSTEADANDTTNAIQLADNLNSDPSSALTASLAASSGSSLIGFIQSGGVARTVQSKLRDVLSVKDFGAVGNGVADDTAEIQAAIDAVSSAGGLVYLPRSVYLTTSTLLISQQGTHFAGEGVQAAFIKFNPTANDTCIEFENGSSTINRFSLTGLSFISADTSFVKTIVNVIDGVSYVLANLSCTTWTDATDSCIGIKINGREAGSIRDIIFNCDRPIVIGPIEAPHTPSGIGCDHHNFHNLDLLTDTNPIIEIETGTIVSQVSFTGYQAWVHGTYGLYWVDTTSVGVSNGLILENVRNEGVDNEFVHIEHNTTLQSLRIKGGTNTKGFYLRNVDNFHLDSFYFSGTGLAIDVDATVKRISGVNCFWQAGSTANLVGQNLISASPKNPSTGALAPNFIYDEASNATKITTIGPVVESYNVTLADAGEHTFAGAAAAMIFISDDGDATAQFATKGGVAGTVEISDWAGLYSVAKGTGTSANIYAESGVYKLQNNRGAELTFSVTIVGNG